MEHSKAFAMGVAFRLGAEFGRCAMAQDESIKFRTIKNGNVIAIKDGKVLGGGGAAVGVDRLPTFSSFMSSKGGVGFTAGVRSYAEIHLKPVVEALRYPKGMPTDCERIVMGMPQIRELAAHMNSDKAEVLPFLADVYRIGQYRIAKDIKHPNDFEAVVYTTATITVGRNRYKVELVSKRRKNEAGNRYIQYGISKADKAEDRRLKSEYLMERVNIKRETLAGGS